MVFIYRFHWSTHLGLLMLVSMSCLRPGSLYGGMFLERPCNPLLRAMGKVIRSMTSVEIRNMYSKTIILLPLYKVFHPPADKAGIFLTKAHFEGTHHILYN